LHPLVIDKNVYDKKQLFLINTNYTLIDNENGIKIQSNWFNNVINIMLNIFENNYKKLFE